MSAKPMNVEFVLIIDKSDTSTLFSAGDIADSILRAQDHALRNHRENISI